MDDARRPAPRPPRAASDARRFGRNFTLAATAQLVSQVLTLLASIVLARRLNVSAYGIFVFGFAFPSWFLLVISLGLDEVMSTDIAADRSRANRYMTLVALLRLLLVAIAIGSLYVATQIVLADPFARTITIVLGVSSVINAYAVTFTSIFRAFERLEYAAIVTIVERAATVGTALLLLFSGFGLFEVSLAFLGGSFITLSLSALIARKSFASFTSDVDRKTLAQVVRKAVPFGLANAVGTFTYTTGLVLLTVMKDSASTGLMNAAFTLLFALFSFLNIANYTVLPMMSRINQESRQRLAAALWKMEKLALIWGVPLGLGGWFFAEPIITTFYGGAFRASADVFRILVLCFSVETALMGNGPALAAIGQMKQNTYNAFGGAALTIALSVLLIPPTGIIGAALAFLAAHLFMAFRGALMVRRYIGPYGAWGTAAKALVAGSAMLLVLYVTPGVTLWTGIPLGGFAYLATLLALRGGSNLLRAFRGTITVPGRGALPAAPRTALKSIITGFVMLSKQDGRDVWEGIRGTLLR